MTSYPDGFGAWKNDDGSYSWVSKAKAGKYALVDCNEPHTAGAVTKAEGNPFGKPSVGDWAVASGHGDVVVPQMWNEVRKCGGCGKPNAMTLTECNSCAAALPEETTQTANLFSAIVYGYEAVGLSLRSQTKDVLVIDDLLALSGCHLNAIWAEHFVPDVRFLFAKPAAGLAIVRRMKAALDDVCLKQFAANPDFVKSQFKTPPASPQDFLDAVACGFNTPPSQYQLHMQYILFPVVPFHAANLVKGLHFTKGRFCPISYVEAALAKLAAADKAVPGVDLKTSMDDIFSAVKDTTGLDYEQEWEKAVARLPDVQARYGAYYKDNFDGAHSDKDGADPNTAHDKLLLTSYGRPYGEAGNAVANNHYAHAKAPGDLKPL